MSKSMWLRSTIFSFFLLLYGQGLWGGDRAQEMLHASEGISVRHTDSSTYYYWVVTEKNPEGRNELLLYAAKCEGGNPSRKENCKDKIGPIPYEGFIDSVRKQIEMETQEVKRRSSELLADHLARNFRIKPYESEHFSALSRIHSELIREAAALDRTEPMIRKNEVTTFLGADSPEVRSLSTRFGRHFLALRKLSGEQKWYCVGTCISSTYLSARGDRFDPHLAYTKAALHQKVVSERPRANREGAASELEAKCPIGKTSSEVRARQGIETLYANSEVLRLTNVACHNGRTIEEVEDLIRFERSVK